MKIRGTLWRGAGLGLAHLVLTLILLAYSFGISMSHFDRGAVPQGFDALIQDTVDLVVLILMNPGSFIYEALPAGLRANPMEWLVMSSNSALWGFGLLFLWRKIKRLSVSD